MGRPTIQVPCALATNPEEKIRETVLAKSLQRSLIQTLSDDTFERKYDKTPLCGPLGLLWYGPLGIGASGFGVG